MEFNLVKNIPSRLFSVNSALNPIKQISNTVTSFGTSIGAAIGASAGVGRKHRRIWKGNGRAHIEVKAVHKEGTEHIARDIETSLKKLKGVDWVEVNSVLGRVVVAFSEGSDVDMEDLVDAVEEIEEAHDIHRERFPHERPEHPGDIEPFNRNLFSLSADLVGISAGILGQTLRITPIPTELASVVSLIQNEPRLRRFVENRFGIGFTDVTLGILDSIGQGLSQGPLGLFADSTHRISNLTEIKSRQNVWKQKEPILAGKKGRFSTEPLAHLPRKKPLRSGAIEKYADIATVGSIGAFGAAALITKNPRKSANLIVAMLPKAARFGRESYASHLDRLISNRGAIVMDASTLRRLDRLDKILIDSDVLLTNRWQLKSVQAIGGSNEVQITKQAIHLFNPNFPNKIKISRKWKIGPPEKICNSLSKQTKQIIKQESSGPNICLGLSFANELCGIVTIVPELNPLASALLEAAKDAKLEIYISGKRNKVAQLLEIQNTVLGGSRLSTSVRQLQEDSSGVMFVGKGEHKAGLRTADCGIGIIEGDGDKDSPIPWGADIIISNDLELVYILIEAVRYAKTVSKTSVTLAALGSSIGGTWAMIGPASGAGRRAMLPVNLAALASQGYGFLQAFSLNKAHVPKPPSNVMWHSMEIDDVIKATGSSKSGLNESKASHRLNKSDFKEPALANRFLNAVGTEFANPMTPLLAAGAGLSAAVGSLSDAALVVGVTAANALIGSIQRLKTDASLKQLMSATESKVNVLRNNALTLEQTAKIVVGDIIELADGDVVPADCRIIACENCEVDESTITGEALPVIKSSEPSAGLELADRTSMLYEGTTVVGGKVQAVVVAAGSDTEIGRLFYGIDSPESGVETRLISLTKAILPITILSGVAVTSLGLIWRRPMNEAVTSGVSLTVAAVPEGLPMLATIAQLSSAQRLSKHKALIRHPRTIEALGRVNILCFDKTGTLTAGKIELQSVADGKTELSVNSLRSKSHINVLVSALRASPDQENDDELPHATDKAIINTAQKINISTDTRIDPKTPNSWKTIGSLGFEPSRGFYAVVGRCNKNKTKIVVKGAPEIIIQRCNYWKSPNGTVKLNRTLRQRLNKVSDAMATKGLRVLAVAERESSDNTVIEDERVSNMTLLGFIGLADSVRPTAFDAVAQLTKAGVKVAMITGDHPSTAKAIAEELNIFSEGKILTGSEIDSLNDDELDSVIEATTIFARVSPSHKVRIVSSLQRIGLTVAMTGDGANDAAPIRLSSVGIALGKHGSKAACDAADIVITDDRLETIVNTIIEGRAMWSSVRDAIAILIGGNVGEVAFTVASTAISGQSALNTRQFLLVNLMTDLLPALSIALKPPTKKTPEELLNEGPEASLGWPLAQQIILRAATTSTATTAAWLIGRGTGTKKRANSMALATLVNTQLAQTAVLGGKSPMVLISTVASAAILVTVIQTPVLSQYFGCTPLDPLAWFVVNSSAVVATGTSIVAPKIVSYLLKNRTGKSEELQTQD
ncbi:MAG: cation-translocating P-type ATPase [Actinobacteria bacterium]|nr:cation-translocating P-type ATPase [Actinomycetota bacterium]MCL6104972.1 cation-translocating P-type ATPase [Actinomycetota bacterium]